MFPVGQIVNEIVSKIDFINVAKINDSWTGKERRWECACFYGRMSERAAEGKGSVTSGNRIYRYGKQILFIPMHVWIATARPVRKTEQQMADRWIER